MNLPFGLPAKDLGKRKEEALEAAALYEHKLADYQHTLENYKRYLTESLSKQDSEERRYVDSQLSLVQMALDLTYLKEQGDKLTELLQETKQGPITRTLSEIEGLITAIADTNYKLEGLDKNVVNRLSELCIELQKQTSLQMKSNLSEMAIKLELLEQKAKRSNALLWFLFIFNILSLSGIAFLIVYIFGIIPY